MAHKQTELHFTISIIVFISFLTVFPYQH